MIPPFPDRLLTARGLSGRHPADVVFVARGRLPHRHAPDTIRPRVVLIRRDTVHAVWRSGSRAWPRRTARFAVPPPGVLGPRRCVIVHDVRGGRAETLDADGFAAEEFDDLVRHLRNFQSIQTVGWGLLPSLTRNL